MSAFGTQFAASGVPALFDRLGQAATHRTPAQVSTACTVIFNEMVGFADEKDNAIITSKASQIADPQPADQFVIGSDIWDVIEVRGDRAGTHENRCVKPKVRA